MEHLFFVKDSARAIKSIAKQARKIVGEYGAYMFSGGRSSTSKIEDAFEKEFRLSRDQRPAITRTPAGVGADMFMLDYILKKHPHQGSIIVVSNPTYIDDAVQHHLKKIEQSLTPEELTAAQAVYFHLKDKRYEILPKK